ncbi:MAG: MotA/TolQ/ExbB proton channel family protein [Curvibacter sp.]|nr:MotA/TolQ/ExbB proton channel family protein [Curvibacter sp.]
MSQPAPRRPAGALPIEPLWLEWLALGGLLAFAFWLLGVRGVWALLLHADPTGLTAVIVLVFACSTLWCGSRARTLERQRQALEASLRPGAAGQGWAHEFWQHSSGPAADPASALDLLLEACHGPHGTAWWVNGLQLKLGLLGKVIGFCMLALNIGQLQNLDASQSSELLKSLTTGLGVALLTTMVGLVANILLGLQLTRLDRYADRLVADCQRHALQRRQTAPAP